MSGRPKRDTAASAPPSGDVLLYSTTEGRQRFPDILQVSYGDKAIIGFDRYGRALGAVVPIEAVRILAGFAETVDDDVKRRMAKTAKRLLAQLPREAAICGLGEDATEPKLVEIDEIGSAANLTGARIKKPGSA